MTTVSDVYQLRDGAHARGWMVTMTRVAWMVAFLRLFLMRAPAALLHARCSRPA